MIGKEAARREAAAAARERGDRLGAANILQQPIVVKASAEKRMFKIASVEAGVWVREIEDRCKRVLVNAMAGPYDAALVRQQIYAAITADLEERQGAAQFARYQGRPMKRRDEEKYRRWQQRTSVKSRAARTERLLNDVEDGARARAKDPSLSPAERAKAKRTYQEIAEGRKEGRYPKRLNQTVMKAKAVTTRARTTNMAIIDAAQEDETVTMLQWTTARDAKVCDTCNDYDKWTVKKDDPAVGNFSPPLHYRCRCRWMHVHAEDAKKLKIKATARPDVEPAPGFGGNA